MLDFIIILAIAYFLGIIPLAYFIKSQVLIHMWNKEELDRDLGILKIHQMAGFEAALGLLAGYFFKGYLGLWLAQYLWGNSFINFPAAILLVLGQSNSHNSRESGGLIPMSIGISYYWDINLAGTLSSLWLSTYLLTKKTRIATLLTFSLWPLFLMNSNTDLGLILFLTMAALLVFKNHINDKRASFYERRI